MSLKNLMTLYYNNGNLLDLSFAYKDQIFNQFLTVYIDSIQLFVVIDNHLSKRIIM